MFKFNIRTKNYNKCTIFNFIRHNISYFTKQYNYLTFRSLFTKHSIFYPFYLFSPFYFQFHSNIITLYSNTYNSNNSISHNTIYGIHNSTYPLIISGLIFNLVLIIYMYINYINSLFTTTLLLLLYIPIPIFPILSLVLLWCTIFI